MDRLCWPWDKTGEYTVKTGYKILCEEEDYDSASTSNYDSVVKFWRSLWKLKVPGKIKHFLWKACSDALPTKSNLHRRKISPDDLCSRCAKEPETVIHAMWSCEEVQVAWKKYFGWVEGCCCCVFFLRPARYSQNRATSTESFCCDSLEIMESQKQD